MADSNILENPIQATALYYILVTLNDFGLLENDPLTVAIEREERDPVYPCGRGDHELKMNQVKWANENGKFWFLGSIKNLYIKLKETSFARQYLNTLCQSLDERAKEAGFSIKWFALT